MLWFTMQSVLMLLLAFAVGLLVGWLAWGRQWTPLDQVPVDALGAVPGTARQGDEQGLEAQPDQWPFGSSDPLRYETPATTLGAATLGASTTLHDVPSPTPVVEPETSWTLPDRTASETSGTFEAASAADAAIADADDGATDVGDEPELAAAEESGDAEIADSASVDAESGDVETVADGSATGDEDEDDSAEDDAAAAEDPAAVAAWERPAPEFDWTAGASTALDFAAPSAAPALDQVADAEDLDSPTEVDAADLWASADDAGVFTADDILAESESESAELDGVEPEAVEAEPEVAEPEVESTETAEPEATTSDAAPVDLPDEAAPVEAVAVLDADDEEPAPAAAATPPAPTRLPDDTLLPDSAGVRVIDLTQDGDELTLVDGITPEMSAALKAEGYSTFAAVAAAGEDDLRRALRVNRIRSAPGIALWAQRAAELAREFGSAAPAPADASPSDDAPSTADPATSPAASSTVPTVTAGTTSTVTTTSAATGSATGQTGRRGRASAADAELHDDDREWLERRWREVEQRSEGVTEPEPEPVPVIEGDDLERVVGVTAKIAETLRGAGISTYAQLAAARDEELRALLKDAGLRFPPTLSTWAVQGALLLQGDAEGAATLAGGLMVGQETS